MDRTQRIVLVVVAAAVIYVVATRHVITADALLFFAVLIPSVILHEVSHGAVALLFGDDTAKRAGRLTLNPVAHIDPMGTVILPAILVLSAGMAFGYAKPVPVNPGRMRSPRNHGLVVALAGPAVNICLALFAALLLTILHPPNLSIVAQLLSQGHLVDLGAAGWGVFARVVFEFGIANVILAAFNLIPVPPLDGSAVVERLLPAKAWPTYLRLRQYAMVLVLLLVFLGGRILDKVFGPALWLWSRVL
jgi:Zn-dependent protease